jgi:anti-sigma B factor antagonist
MSGCSRPIEAGPVPGPPTIVVTLPAEIDVGNSGLVQAALAGALASAPKVVIADGTGTGFCDCSAIAALMFIHHQATAAGAQLRVVVSSAAVRRVLELTGADHVLLVYRSLDDSQGDGSHPPVPPLAAESVLQ